MPEAINTLSYAIRPRIVIKYLGQISFMLAILTLVPTIFSIFFEEYFLTRRYILIVFVLTLFGFFSRKIAHDNDLQNNEALIITALAFILTPFLMSYPIMGSGLTFLDAWFEAISAITTTGLSTVTDLTNKPQTFLFARAWMQWYGGLGIIVLSVALLMGHQTAIKRLVGAGSESMMTTTRLYARRMLLIYIVLTLICMLFLWWMLGDFFIALTHTLAAISTGGFSPMNTSLAEINDWNTRYAIVFFGFLSALPLVLYYRLFRGSWQEALRDPEFRVLLFVIILLCILLSITLQNDLALPWSDAFGHGVLLAVSAQTTTGFTSLDINQLGSDSMILLIIAMVVGGSAGSTAGGIKILRLIIVARLIQLTLQRSAMPSHAVTQTRIGDKILGEDEISRALLLIILYVLVILVSWFIFLLFDYPAMPALFEVTSATGTVGLSSGITSSELHPLLKITLCVDMLLGRLEIIALLIILYPPTWIGKHKDQ